MKTSPFLPLQQVMQSKLDETTRELGRLISVERESQERLKLLQNYREEYLARFREAMNLGLGLEAMRNYQSFISRIDEAIKHQQTELTQSENNSSVAKQAWVAQRNRGIAIDALHARHVSTEERKSLKSEQTQSDERASRTVWNSHRQDEDAE